MIFPIETMKVQSVKKTKIETTYEYVPIIGEILGFWRKKFETRVGTTNILFVRTPLELYDQIVINDVDIPLTDELKEEWKKERTR